jgi:transcriptional regulator with XRE-family HTH domain
VKCSNMVQANGYDAAYASISRCSTIRQVVCHDDPMPSSDPEAKKYEMQLAATFADAVSDRRRALNLTASELARRTAELGYPISRGAIAKIESNSRSGKVDVAELLVLSAALDIPPALLLFPYFRRSQIVLPNLLAVGSEAVRWMSGQTSFPQIASGQPSVPRPPNDGVKLISAELALRDAIVARIPLVQRIEMADEPSEVELATRTLDLQDEHIARLQKEVSDAHSALWFRANSLGHQAIDEG